MQERVFKTKRRVRVGDCDARGIVRVDAIARYLQDIGYDDTDDIGVGDGGFWVARSISMALPEESSLPKRNEFINLETYCGGVGRAFAQRVVNIETESNFKIETLTTWVSVDEAGKPIPVPQWFFDAYPNATKTKATRTLPLIDFASDFNGQIVEWKIRASDVDVNDHVNNAMAFSALYEVSQIAETKCPTEISVEYYSPLAATDETRIYIQDFEGGFDAWLVTGNNISAAMRWS